VSPRPKIVRRHAIIVIKQEMKQNMLINMKHICKKFIFHVLHELSHGWVALRVYVRSNTATKKYFKSLLELAKPHQAGDA